MLENITPKTVESRKTPKREDPEERKVYFKKYREENKEILAKKQKEYCEKNKGDRKKQQAEYREKNRERKNAKARERYYKNREKLNEYSRKYHKENRHKVNAQRKGKTFKPKQKEKRKGGIGMKYMGSKARFSNEILPIILQGRQQNQYYVEPFAGGMNMICEVDGNRIANDVHYYLVKMWEELTVGWIPDKVSKERYLDVKANPNNYPPYFVGWVGFNCSYSGKWFGGFAGETKTKIGTIRDYQTEAINNVIKQVKKMEGVIFQNKPFLELELPTNSIVYCDPPYEGTTGYADEFDHNIFWKWVRKISNQGHSVFISEYNAPEDFECIWKKEAKSSLSANGKIGGNKISVEKLFRPK